MTTNAKLAVTPAQPGIGMQLALWRKRRGLSLGALEDVSGVAKSVIWHIENGETTNPGIETLAKLADGLGTTLGVLLTDALADCPHCAGTGVIENG